MKKFFLILIVMLLVACAAYAQVEEPADAHGTTYHWMLQNADDAWILCANGNFVVEVNGHDSIRVICQPQGGGE